MIIDTVGLDGERGHDLLKGIIGPRPIAWITSLHPNGVVNVAPFSCFTFVAFKPMTVCLSFERVAAGGDKKATLRNIERTREFVIHPATEQLVHQVNDTSRHLPEMGDKLASLGLTTVPSERVLVPRIEQCPIALECRLIESRPLTQSNDLILAEVVSVFLPDGLYEGSAIDYDAYRPVGRMHGDFYALPGKLVEIPRPWNRPGG
jgi:flavin reductase (DIM6/NTAB) family NADH-FMN oxidoreductase RutF